MKDTRIGVVTYNPGGPLPDLTPEHIRRLLALAVAAADYLRTTPSYAELQAETPERRAAREALARAHARLTGESIAYYPTLPSRDA